MLGIFIIKRYPSASHSPSPPKWFLVDCFFSGASRRSVRCTQGYNICFYARTGCLGNGFWALFMLFTFFMPAMTAMYSYFHSLLGLPFEAQNYNLLSHPYLSLAMPLAYRFLFCRLRLRLTDWLCLLASVDSAASHSVFYVLWNLTIEAL